MIRRRGFLEAAGLGLPNCFFFIGEGVARGHRDSGWGRCAAALAGLESGCCVILVEETGWMGGQLTQQSVSPDEHSWIEQFGATQLYGDFRQLARDLTTPPSTNPLSGRLLEGLQVGYGTASGKVTEGLCR